MTYSIEILALGQDNAIAIDKTEFDEIKSAKETLDAFFTLTENYRIVVEAYRQVERASLDAVLGHVVFTKNEYQDSADARVMLSTPLFGYLATSRYFLDASDKLLPAVIGDGEVKAFKQCEARFTIRLPNTDL